LNTSWLMRDRPIGLLLAIGLAIGVAHALTLLPLEMLWGDGPFWAFPQGTFLGGWNDFADTLVGYLYFQKAAWHWPLLLLSQIMPPAGTNLFWLDAVPWVSLLGKLLYDATGWPVNLLGAFQFAGFALSGPAMVAVLVAFGQRGLLATMAGAVLAVALPFHLAEWGHPALCAQFLILLALAYYGVSVRGRPPRRLAMPGLGLLALTLLTNIYLFVMVGGIWVAALVQRRINGTGIRRLAIEAAATIAAIVAIMVVTGILTPDLRSSGSTGFGALSLNLGSPFIPQNSGVIAPLRNYLIGGRVQVYGYLGLGVLFALLVAAATSVRWWWRARYRHAVLLALLLADFLFALSHRVTLGSHVLLQVPLPGSVVYALGMFRSSGRFFWPAGYALVVLAVVTVATRLRPPAAAAALAVACLLQLIDVGPMRQSIAATSGVPARPVVDRQRADALAAGVHALALFPSFGCVPWATSVAPAAVEREHTMFQRAMEFQLIAARRNLPINSVYNARVPTDCVAEAAMRGKTLRRGVLYVYLDGELPDASQFGGADPAVVCSALGEVRACKIPNG
jgi:hypothetical protein